MAKESNKDVNQANPKDQPLAGFADDLAQENALDCSFIRQGSRFRLRAAAVIVKDGCVLMAKNERDPYYYSVGGAVRLGEEVQAALLREVREETGYALEMDRLLVIHENFFPGEDGCAWHELAFYYLMKTPGDFASEAHSHSMTGALEEMVWIPIKDYADYLAYPRF